MIVLTAAQMREADRRCIEELGIPGAVLMDNAGAAVFREIAGGPVGIVCGKGNNGGDGFVVARFALLAGLEPTVLLAAEPSHITGDAKTFMDVYLRLGGRIVVATEAKTAARAVADLVNCATLVDALLGTGISGEVREMARAIIDAWPRDPITIAVDLPSGLNADTGEACGASIHADVTVTFAFAKQGLLVPEAEPYVGRLVVADIGIPDICASEEWVPSKPA